MKIALAAVVFVLALIETSQAESCRQEPERCKEGECCVEFGMFGKCKPLRKDGEECELKSIQPSREKHVYMIMCPCGKGLACKESGDTISPLLGKCVVQE